MTIICKNCGEEFSGKFCHNCGQESSVQRLDWKFVFKELREKIISFDRSKLFTIKQLFTRPGYAIKDFVDGKRVNYFKPFSLLLIAASIFAFLSHYFNIDLFSEAESTSPDSEKSVVLFITQWFTSHYALAAVLTVPLYSTGSFIAFRKQGFNYVEHLVLNSYLASLKMIIRIALFPLLYIYNGTNELTYITRIYILMDFVILVWGYSQFFSNLTFVQSFLRTILSYVIFHVCLMITMVAIISLLNLFGI